MGNRTGAFCGGSVCPRDGVGGENEILDDSASCDPAGAVFQETLEDLSELDRLLLTFASSSNVAAVRWLLLLGASAEACDAHGTTCLHAACRSGSLSVVRDFAKRQLPLNAPDVAGWTALHVALFMGRRAVGLLLLEQGADCNLRNHKGLAPADLCSDAWLREAVAACQAHRRSYGTRQPWRYSKAGDLSEAGQAAPSRLRFEPFFVPRAPALKEKVTGNQLLDVGIEIFNERPGQGIAFLVATGTVRDFPVELSGFLAEERVSPQQVGEFLGENFSLSQTLRLEYINSVRLANTGVVGCLVKIFKQCRIPAELMKMDRLVDGVAQIWWRQHEQLKDFAIGGGHLEDPNREAGEVQGLSLMGHLPGYDVLHQLMLSTILLHWSLFSPAAAHMPKVTQEQWIELNLEIEHSGSADPNAVGDMGRLMLKHIQSQIYSLVSKGPLPQLHWRPSLLGRLPLSATQEAANSPAREPAKGKELVVRMQGWVLIVGGSFPSLVGASGTVTYRHIRSILSETTSSPLCLASPATSRSSQPGGAAAPLSGAAVAAAAAGAAPPFAREERPGGGRAGGARRPPSGGRLPSAIPEGRAVSTAAGQDRVWLSLREDLLFLASRPNGWAAYAFVHLAGVCLECADRERLTLTLAMKAGPRSPRKDEPPNLDVPQLQLVFLLPDGRWQLVDVPSMQLEVPDIEQFERWRACLEEHSRLETSRMAAGAQPPQPPGEEDDSVEATQTI